MKKFIITFFCLVAISMGVEAQSLVSTFRTFRIVHNMEHAMRKGSVNRNGGKVDNVEKFEKFEIEPTVTCRWINEDKYQLYIRTNINRNIGYILDSNEIDKFISFLEKTQTNFENNKKIAEENFAKSYSVMGKKYKLKTYVWNELNCVLKSSATIQFEERNYLLFVKSNPKLNSGYIGFEFNDTNLSELIEKLNRCKKAASETKNQYIAQLNNHKEELKEKERINKLFN